MPGQDPRPIVRIEIDRPVTPPSSHSTQISGLTPHTTSKLPEAHSTKSTFNDHAAETLHQIQGHRWFSWVQPRLRWPFFKPVIRCAVAAWLGFLVQLILPSERALGYAAFFVLVVAFMLPPSQPFIQSVEILANLYFFTAIAWAWLALGVFVAGQVRSPVNPAKIAAAETKWGYLKDDSAAFSRHLIYDATYVEAKSAVVCGVFLAVGTGAFLWYKLRTQPSPATLPLVLSCILMDIGFTTAALYPFPLYTSGLLFFLPMAVQGGIAAVCSLLIFPESVGHSFQGKMTGVLGPLHTALDAMVLLFTDAVEYNAQLSPMSSCQRLDMWAEKSQEVRVKLLQSLAGIPPLRAQQRYLHVDLSYARLSGSDLRDVFDRLAILQTRSGGMAFFFDVIAMNARHLHLDSSAFSVHDPSHSRPPSRPASIRNSAEPDRDLEDGSDHEMEGGATKRFHLPGFFHRRSGSPHGLASHRASHTSLLDHLRRVQQPVGVYESQRYMDVERAFSDDTEHILEQLGLLASAALPLAKLCTAGLLAADEWLKAAKRRRKLAIEQEELRAALLSEHIASLQRALDEFRVARLEAIGPYRHLFDPAHPPADDIDHRKLKHRGLFQVFVAQYHLIEFCDALLRLLRVFEDFDKTRVTRRLWYPQPSVILHHFRRSHEEDRHLTDGDDGHDNDIAFEATEEEALGEAKTRNPEYTPFDNPYLNLLSPLSALPDLFRSRSFMYAAKAAALTTLTTLPQFVASSAAFYYDNRGIWCTIMAQLTLAVYSGDTTAAWLGRCVASFWGALFGMIVWYIGSGSGQGNAYGLAAACAVTFPVAMFFRVHFPGQVLTAIMTPVTFGLVIGYSYLNGTIFQLTSATWGFDVAWRRFVCVLIGITAAWIFSYRTLRPSSELMPVPPTYSAKKAIRQSYAGTIAAGGTILCDIITHANSHHIHLSDDVNTRTKLLNWRSKLNKLKARHANAVFEYSLRGRWPEERYQALHETLQDLLSLLSQLNHVLSQLERPWRRALLERTRLCEPMFLGDVMAVISMSSTALRSGLPLPQITPSPLVTRFRLGKFKGLELPADPLDHTGELPSLVTVEVLESDDYMRYALGVTTTFSILSRLDRIVIICKTLLGENFHIGGLHLESQGA